jgi:hypothetical protein
MSSIRGRKLSRVVCCFGRVSFRLKVRGFRLISNQFPVAGNSRQLGVTEEAEL